jgi:hypothetical protein
MDSGGPLVTVVKFSVLYNERPGRCMSAQTEHHLMFVQTDEIVCGFFTATSFGVFLRLC